MAQASEKAQSAALKDWLVALDKGWRFLSAYTEQIDNAASRIRPAARRVYRAALADTAKVFELEPSFEGKSLRGVYDLFDRLDRGRATLYRGAAAAFAPALAEQASIRMSGSYAQNMKRLRNETTGALRAAEQAAIEACREALGLYGAAGAAAEDATALPLREAVAAYEAPPPPTEGEEPARRSPPSARLHAGLLALYRLRGADTEEYVRRAQDEALGAERRAESLDDRLRRLHPLQAAGFTFGATPGPAGELPAGANGVVVDPASLGGEGSSRAVEYDLAALIDPARAGRDTTRSGLNRRLAVRLDTQREAEVDRAAGSATAWRPGAPLWRTADRRAWRPLQRPDGPLPARAMRGPRPRVEAFARLAGEAVAAEAEGRVDPQRLNERFEAAENIYPSVAGARRALDAAERDAGAVASWAAEEAARASFPPPQREPDPARALPGSGAARRREQAITAFLRACELAKFAERQSASIYASKGQDAMGGLEIRPSHKLEALASGQAGEPRRRTPL
jgi:hypothetical protein